MNMKVNTHNKGFTLLELLVVIAIIGILAASIFAFFSTARAKSRDSRRVGDIQQLQNALSIYYASTNTFPTCATENTIANCLADLIPKNAISVLPRDPQQSGLGAQSDCGVAGKQLYCYQSTDGSTYVLRYDLETNSIPGKPPGWNPVSP